MLFEGLFVLSTAFAITFCNVKDCYEIEEHIIEQKTEECVYQARMNMLVLDWKKRNDWKQVEWVGGNKRLNCFPVTISCCVAYNVIGLKIVVAFLFRYPTKTCLES